MWDLGHKEGWALKSWCFQAVVLEKTFESPSDSKHIKQVNPKGNQPWLFIVRLIEICQENAVVIANTLFQQHKRRLHMDITRWSILTSDWLYSLQPKMEKLYTVSKHKTRSWLWLRTQTPDSKFRLKLKKVGKTTRPFRYDLNQIPYNYTVEVRNRFNGLDLKDRVPEELWMEVRDIVQETGIKTIPQKKKCKKANGCLRRRYK